ncbi:MAG: ATP-binding cassette domain-containing protein [Propionibacterium sp.]|nr:ATP-binding cassette domain-containing protein [Propionibacterium sp.]
MTADLLVHAEGLYVSLDGIPVLRDVGIDVAAGEAVGLHGGNGSGKSTLIRTIVGLVPHQEGTLRLFGQPSSKFHDWQRIGYVPQHSAINVPNATVREVASSGRLPHRRPFRWAGRQDRRAIDESLEQVGLIDRRDWPFTALSGGQKQRTLIARALATRPDLFVMDEPMAGVDLHSQEGLGHLLSDLVHDGAGLLVVLHEIGAVELDRSVTLCDGRMTDEEHDGNPGHATTIPEPSFFGLEDPLVRNRND